MESAPAKKRLLPVALVICLVAVSLIYGLQSLRRPDIESLANQALAGSPADQIKAAQQLALLGQPAVTAMRRVMTNSDNDEVIAISILGLSRNRDYQSMNHILTCLDDPSATVRSAAAVASTNLLGRNHHFPVNGSLEARARVRNEMIRDWESYNGSELFEFNKNRL